MTTLLNKLDSDRTYNGIRRFKMGFAYLMLALLICDLLCLYQFGSDLSNIPPLLLYSTKVGMFIGGVIEFTLALIARRQGKEDASLFRKRIYLGSALWILGTMLL